MFTIIVPYLHGEEYKNYKTRRGFNIALAYYKKIYGPTMEISLGANCRKFINTRKF